MADVFLSYASEDRDYAARLAHALEATGLVVWWDRHIVIGEAYDTAIERELKSAHRVVVLWSSHSVASEWVKNEAALAAERGVLLPAMIEQVELPLEFRRKQTADLSDWDGDLHHPGFQALLHGITALGTPAETKQQVSGARPAKRSDRSFASIVFALLVLIGGAALITWLTLPDEGNRAAPADVADVAVGADVASANSRVPVSELVAGTYYGGVISDSKGSSRNGVTITLTKIDNWTVRVTSDYARIAPMEITIDRIGDTVVQAGGDTAFYLTLASDPIALTFSPHNELTYGGEKIDE